MFIGHNSLTCEVAAGSAFALLARLAVTSRVASDELPGDVGAALAAVGDTEGDSWLNLLGVALDAGPPFTVERLLAAFESLDGVELRRHLLGRYAWSWCTLAGIGDIEAAAAGDSAAAARLLAHPRYYAGHARQSLGTLLSLEPEETHRRIVTAAEAGSRLLLAPTASAGLEAAASQAATLLATEPALTAIERIARGYRYVPELEAERVILVPHLEPRLSLVLAQHRSARLIAYRVEPDRGSEERLLTLGRALADPKRVEILMLVGRGVARAADLVDATGLTRSTVHHHLAQLRDAGLVALEGNARAYTYVPRAKAVDEAAALLADIVRTEED
ncbi:MAG TPA: winged helix-turn-helix domain-containing protein [Gaiellaceae bacterium]|nr:winged helix-turn-helix domain-containing protein [Gaiellaceae bacterium]